jgi:hypothetical protein
MATACHDVNKKKSLPYQVQSVHFYIPINSTNADAHPELFIGGGGADPEAMYNLCSILKIML